MLKMIHKASGNPVTFAEIAEVVYDDPLAEVQSALYRLRDKLEGNGFPKTIIVKNQTARLE